jgi:Skp family chaperone for outer membrane proteins
LKRIAPRLSSQDPNVVGFARSSGPSNRRIHGSLPDEAISAGPERVPRFSIKIGVTRQILEFTDLRLCPNFPAIADRKIQPTTRLSKKEFWMRKFGVSLALTCAAVWMTGCGTQIGGQSSSSSRGSLAVVDLDKVAAETGKNLEMKDQYQLQQNSYQQALIKFQADATAELKKKVKELEDKGIDLQAKGDESAEKEKAEVAQYQINARNTLAQAQNAAGAKLGELKQAQIAKFRTELKPILQEVAAKRGMSVVIPKNDGLLLSVDPGVDITDDVIKAYREKKPAPAAATAAAPAASTKPETAPAKSPAPKTASKAPAKDTE